MTVLNGHPDVLRGMATTMQGTAARMRAQARVLAMLRRGATWQSPAGVAFGARLKVMPTTLDQAVHRYAAAARALRGLASAMDKSQPVVTQAIADWREAERQILSLQGRIDDLISSGADRDSTQVLRLGQAQTELVGTQNNLVKAHDEAWRLFRAADARCAAVLAATARDCVSDTTAYRTVNGARATAAGVEETVGAFSVVAPEFAPVATVAGTVARTGELGMLVFYDEGSWKALGVNAAFTATGSIGGALVKGSLAGSRRVGSTIIGTPSMTTGQRIKEGIRLQTHQEKNALRSSVGRPEKPLPPATRTHPEVVSTTRGGSAPKEAGRVEQTLAQVSGVDGQRVRQAREEWLLASAGGGNATRMYVAGEALKEASTRGQDAYATSQTEQKAAKDGEIRAAVNRDAARERGVRTPGTMRGP